MIEKTCEVCASPFRVKPYRRDKARFCSFQCSGKWHMANRKMPDEHKLGNKWRAGMRPANAFTAEQSRALHTVSGERHTCAKCGATFEIKPWLARQNATKSGKRFCTKACHSAFKAEHQAGENAPDYVGGVTTYRGKGWPQARAAAVARDGGTCQECGVCVGPSIPVHHIRPYRLFSCSREANVLSNLLCLCQPCHMRVERHAA